jgi:hypothetical protein
VDPSGTDDLTKLRSEWREYGGCRVGSMDDEALPLDDPTTGIDRWERLLTDFEQLANPSRCDESRTVVTNMYAKGQSFLWNQQQREDAPMGEWTPTPAVRRSAKEYMAFVVSAT